MCNDEILPGQNEVQVDQVERMTNNPNMFS